MGTPEIFSMAGKQKRNTCASTDLCSHCRFNLERERRCADLLRLRGESYAALGSRRSQIGTTYLGKLTSTRGAVASSNPLLDATLAGVKSTRGDSSAAAVGA